MRIAIFVDQIFWRDGDVISTNESYILFPLSFVDRVEEIVLIGREAPEQGRAPYVIDDAKISLLSIPYYPSLYQLWRANPIIYSEILRAVNKHASHWDAFLVCGPHPIGQMIARRCIKHGVPVIPMVRQNLVGQMNAHENVFLRTVAVTAAYVLEWDFKRLSQGRAVLAVGTEMTKDYGRYTARAYNHFPCLVDQAHFEFFASMSPGNDPTRLICVCRLAPEKGHKFLFDAMLKLRKAGLICHLDVVGDGELEQELKSYVRAIGIEEQVTFRGYVTYGPDLFELYQRAGALVLPSLTEGFPQVINESLSIGLPTVCTAVGGIPSFLTNEKTGLLVPPKNVDALAQAITRIMQDANLRDTLRANGRALMRENTLEQNRARVFSVIEDEIARSKGLARASA